LKKFQKVYAKKLMMESDGQMAFLAFPAGIGVYIGQKKKNVPMSPLAIE
jgi:hypothetical protein